MPNHESTIEVSKGDMEKGARKDEYARILADWRADKITDEQWEKLRRDDPEFSRWLWKMGAI